MFHISVVIPLIEVNLIEHRTKSVHSLKIELNKLIFQRRFQVDYLTLSTSILNVNGSWTKS